MVINVGGLWERPTAIAEHRSDAPQVTLPSNICSESKYGDHHQTWTGLLSFRSSSSSCCNGTRESVRTNPSPEQFGAEQEDRDAIGKDGIIYNSESNGESWDRVEPSNLDSEEYAINGYSVCTENNFKANGISLKDGISASEQMFPDREAFNNFPADRPDGSWKRKGCTDSREGGDHAGGGRENVICIHASKALRVRSSGGKDRHSKVKTARGLRDRRVRLSVSTALQFYDIQDRLGYEQPSKALDWLLMKAKCAIDELPIPSGISNISCVSCKTISTISTSAIISAEVAASTSRSAGSSVSMRELSVQEAYTDSKDIAADFIISSSQQCSTMADARRSRDRARERARERAKQKVSGSKPRHSRDGVPTQSTQITFPYVPSSDSQGTNSYANYVSLPYPQDGSLLSHDQQISLLDGYIRAGLDPRFDSTSNTERLLHYSPHIAVPDTISPPSGRLEGANNSSNILSPSSAQLHSGDQALVMKKTRYISTPPPFNANVPYNHLGTADDDHDSGENFNSNLSEKCSTIPTFINVSASSSEDILGNVCNMDQSALMTGLLMNRGALQSMTSRPADVITSTPSTIYDEVQFMRNDIPWSPLQCDFSPRIRQRILEGFRFDREQYSNNITTPREQNR